jgi:hypothetical protein
VLSNFDIVQQAGARTALDKSFVVSVADGALDLAFSTVVDNAKVDGIEILPSGTAATATPTAIVLATSTPTATPAETTPPSVAITSPADGAVVPRNSAVTIAATAADNVGVARVEFYVNGTLTCTDTTASYTCAWSVPGKRGAAYTLLARAYDPSGNSAQASVRVTASR